MLCKLLIGGGYLELEVVGKFVRVVEQEAQMVFVVLHDQGVAPEVVCAQRATSCLVGEVYELHAQKSCTLIVKHAN